MHLVLKHVLCSVGAPQGCCGSLACPGPPPGMTMRLCWVPCAAAEARGRQQRGGQPLRQQGSWRSRRRRRPGKEPGRRRLPRSVLSPHFCISQHRTLSSSFAYLARTESTFAAGSLTLACVMHCKSQCKQPGPAAVGQPAAVSERRCASGAGSRRSSRGLRSAWTGRGRTVRPENCCFPSLSMPCHSCRLPLHHAVQGPAGRCQHA